MSDSLVVYTVPDEMLGWVQRQRETRRRIEADERTSAPLDYRQQAVTEFGIPNAGIWEPPRAPRQREWWRKPELRRRHDAAVRRSLAKFLNAQLARLDHMLRTRSWMLGKVRVRVVERAKRRQRGK